ncbi:hypothetical protein QR680_000524 [Steinernema hermaphroditum]|uniref:Uncharacterized protein n=1 Tax=Steinernema hermaphroditum TaxID=289476 RepID=A0AA39LDQ6_9BILA|nr:hypothetical protein QR680_000524 [Steinernema hermaphroditum]
MSGMSHTYNIDTRYIVLLATLGIIAAVVYMVLERYWYPAPKKTKVEHNPEISEDGNATAERDPEHGYF